MSTWSCFSTRGRKVPRREFRSFIYGTDKIYNKVLNTLNNLHDFAVRVIFITARISFQYDLHPIIRMCFSESRRLINCSASRPRDRYSINKAVMLIGARIGVASVVVTEPLRSL